MVKEERVPLHDQRLMPEQAPHEAYTDTCTIVDRLYGLPVSMMLNRVLRIFAHSRCKESPRNDDKY